MYALEALLIVLIPKWCAITIDCVSGDVCDLFHTQGHRTQTCFIPSVHEVEHTVPATGDVCVGYVVCITTCLCMQVTWGKNLILSMCVVAIVCCANTRMCMCVYMCIQMYST